MQHLFDNLQKIVEFLKADTDGSERIFNDPEMYESIMRGLLLARNNSGFLISDLTDFTRGLMFEMYKRRAIIGDMYLYNDPDNNCCIRMCMTLDVCMDAPKKERGINRDMIYRIERLNYPLCKLLFKDPNKAECEINVNKSCFYIDKGKLYTVASIRLKHWGIEKGE